MAAGLHGVQSADARHQSSPRHQPRHDLLRRQELIPRSDGLCLVDLPPRICPLHHDTCSGFHK